MHVHLIEPRADGHRMQYVRRLIEQAPQGWTISLSTFAGALQHPGTQAAVAAANGRLQIQPIAGEAAFEKKLRGADGFRLQPAYWQLVRRHWQALSPAQRGSLVVLPYMDYVSYAIALLGSPFGHTPFAGIVMRPDFHWPEQGVVAPPAKHRALKRWLFLKLLRHPRLQRLVTIDASLLDWVAAHQPAGHQRLCYAEDPSDLQGLGGRAEARLRYGLRPAAPVVLLFGSIDMRKGVAHLLDLASHPVFPADAQLLFVGRQTDEVRSLLSRHAGKLPPGRLVVVDDYVNRQDEWLAFAAADFGWVAYEGFFGPSGVVAQCRQARLPMIHRGQGLIGYQLRQAQTVHSPWLHALGLQVSQLAPATNTTQQLQQVFA